MTAPADQIVACKCGRAYREATWQALRLAGYVEDLELRECLCGSTISVVRTQAQALAAAPRLTGGRVAEKLRRAADEIREAGESFEEAAERLSTLEAVIRLRDERINQLQAELSALATRVAALERPPT